MLAFRVVAQRSLLTDAEIPDAAVMPLVGDRAQANVDRATAWLVLGRVNEAIDSYKAALMREGVCLLAPKPRPTWSYHT